MYVRVQSYTLHGVEALPIEVEVHVGRGLPIFDMVGLPEGAVKEGRQRIRAALNQCGIRLPAKKIVVNLAPSGMRKRGTHFDLPIALAIVATTGDCRPDLLAKCMIAGELTLSGHLRPVPGTLAAALLAHDRKLRYCLFPPEDIDLNLLYGELAQGSLASEKLECRAVNHLQQAISLFNSGFELQPSKQQICGSKQRLGWRRPRNREWLAIRGQSWAKRGLQIAAAGMHSIAMIGPPGSGKTMLGRALHSLLPEPHADEKREIAVIRSVAQCNQGSRERSLWRPFRHPHHSASVAAMLGSGGGCRPGELALAHRGILFLDEFLEFRRDLIEAMRGPLESGCYELHRRWGRLTYPCRTLLVLAMNPCPCGYYGDEHHDCRCSSATVDRYQAKFSGPIADRIDLHLWIAAEEICWEGSNDGSSLPASTDHIAASGLDEAVSIQRRRFAESGWHFNSDISADTIEHFCALSTSCVKVLKTANRQLHLNRRSYHRLLKVARTIADLEGTRHIEPHHLLEALQFRQRIGMPAEG